MKLKTVLAGFGMIGAGLAEDTLMAKYFDYATHAQVLRDHPGFEWAAVIDPSEAAREEAVSRWSVPVAVADVSELPDPDSFTCLVLATPPATRTGIIDGLPGLSAVLAEKPLGSTSEDAQAFVEACRNRAIALQVNLWRRADELYGDLASGGLPKLIGTARAAFGVYGNGILNNGVHMVDLCRMLFGEVREAYPVNASVAFTEGPIPGDMNVPCVLEMESGLTVMFQPVIFKEYRENSLDVWGQKGRLSLMQEGLWPAVYLARPNRGLLDELEIPSDTPCGLTQTCGQALYRMYDNLVEHLEGKEKLFSPGDSALISQKIVSDVVARSVGSK